MIDNELKWVPETRQWSSQITRFKIEAFAPNENKLLHLNSKRLTDPNSAIKSQKAQFHFVSGTTALEFNLSPLAPV